MLKDAIDFTQLRRALIVKLRHHGDVLLTSPMFRVLRQNFPHLEVDALVYADTQDMLTLNPHIRTVHSVSRRREFPDIGSYLSHELALFKTLRQQGYDIIFHLTESNRGLWIVHALRPRFSVSYSFRHRDNWLWRKSFTHLSAQADHRRHTVEKHLDTLRRVGIYPANHERALQLVPGDTAEANVTAKMAANGLKTKEFVVVHPTSRWLFKCWEPLKYAALIDRLAQDGERIVLTAAPTGVELQFVERITAATQSPVVNLAGKLSLKELAALIQRARYFVGVDSVPMHIAAAMQTPVLALFGPSGDLEWGPWQVTSQVVTGPQPCRPCGLDGCGGSKRSECLSDIPVEAVVRAAQRLALS